MNTLSQDDLQAKRQLVVKALQTPEFINTIGEADIPNLYLVIEPIIKSSVDSKIGYLSKSNVESNVSLLRRSLNKEMELFIKEKMKKYLFDKKRWKHGVPIIAYLRSCIYFFNAETQSTNFKLAKIQLFACPACRVYLVKSKLEELSDGRLRCRECEEIIRNNDTSFFKDRIDLSKKLYLHSKNGTRCPRCERFVPLSLKVDGKLICPYCFENAPECNQSVKVPHPVGSFHQFIDDFPIDTRKALGFSQEEKLSNKQQVNIKIEKLKQIIKEQQKVNGKTRPSPNKNVMYQAIYSTLEKEPLYTFNYIVRKLTNNSLPLQSLIFQDFSEKMMSLLPVTFLAGTKNITVTEPTDSRLNLFTGHLQFIGTVDEALVLKKETMLSKFKQTCKYSCDTCKSPHVCSFIGYVTKIVNEDGKNLMDSIDNYGFTSIKFKDNKKVNIGDVVTVNYFSIPAHYSVKSMAHMQRIIKRIQQSCTNREL